MTTVLIWLGSGFAFGLGIVVGVWLMRKANGLDAMDKRRIEEYERQDKHFVERNGIAQDQAETLAEIMRLMQRFEERTDIRVQPLN